MAALMLVLPTEATTEAKTTHVWTNAIPCTTEDHKLFKKIWIHTSRHINNIDSKKETGKS